MSLVREITGAYQRSRALGGCLEVDVGLITGLSGWQARGELGGRSYEHYTRDYECLRELDGRL